MNEITVDMKSYFNTVYVNDRDCSQKRKPVLDSRNINVHIEKISVFIEKYSQLDEYLKSMNHPASLYSAQSTIQSINDNLPSWFIKIEDVLIRLQTRIDNFMTHNSRITIKREFYNMFTDKKGYELINGVCVEDGIMIKDKSYNILLKKLELVIDDEIEYILNPKYRKIKLRKDKLERVLSKWKN